MALCLGRRRVVPRTSCADLAGGVDLTSPGNRRALQVYKARCKPLDEIVAIKILDLERQDPGKLVRLHLCLGRLKRTQRPPSCGQQPRSPRCLWGPSMPAAAC